MAKRMKKVDARTFLGARGTTDYTGQFAIDSPLTAPAVPKVAVDPLVLPASRSPAATPPPERSPTVRVRGRKAIGAAAAERAAVLWGGSDSDDNDDDVELVGPDVCSPNVIGSSAFRIGSFTAPPVADDPPAPPEIVPASKPAAGIAAAGDAPFVATRTHVVTMAVAAALAGTMGGLTNVGGPVLMCWALLMGVPKTVARGVFPMVFGVAFQIRLYYGLAMGEYDPRLWMAHVVHVAGGLAGFLVGNHFAAGLSQETFSFLVAWMLLLGAVSLARLAAPWVVLSFALCLASTIVMACLRRPR